MTKPNILLFMSDNQPAGLLGCYGNQEIQTPHLDALAHNGWQLGQTYCVNAMCSPCRASVLTGLMPSQHGLHTWLDDALADQWPERWNAIGEWDNFPARFKQAGYQTALIGKYHLGDASHPPWAFDHWVTFPHGHTVDFHGNEMIDNGRRYVHAGHSVEFFTDKTVEFIGQRSAPEKPFFAFVPYNGPYGHWPAIKGKAGTQFDQAYETVPMHSIAREGINADVIRRFAMRVLDSGGMPHERFMGPIMLPNHLESLRNYFAQMSLIDAGVGKILAALKASGELDNTIVIYTADHGFSLGDHGIWGHGLAAWPSSMREPSTHVPLIISWPAHLQPGHSNDLISQLDIGPTLLEMAGLDPQLNAGADARSFASLLGTPSAQNSYSARDAVFIEQEETRVIRTKDWLYFRRFNGASAYPIQDELFNLRDDPQERHDCTAEHPSTATDLAARVDAFFGAHADPRYDLWNGGAPKSNGSFDTFWRDAWGPQWSPLIGPNTL